MGVDFTLAWVDLRDGTSEMVEELFRIWKSKINNVSSTARLDFERYDLDCENLMPFQVFQAIRATLRGDLKDVRQATLGRSCDAFVMQPPYAVYDGRPTRLLFCGGVSWGGDVSDLYSSVERLYDAGILDLTVTEEIVLSYRLAQRRGRVTQIT